MESEAVVSLKARRGGGAKPPFVPREVRCVFFFGWMDGFFNVVFFWGEVEKRDVGLFLDSEVVFFCWMFVIWCWMSCLLSVGIWLYVQLWMCCLLASYS